MESKKIKIINDNIKELELLKSKSTIEINTIYNNLILKNIDEYPFLCYINSKVYIITVYSLLEKTIKHCAKTLLEQSIKCNFFENTFAKEFIHICNSKNELDIMPLIYNNKMESFNFNIKKNYFLFNENKFNLETIRGIIDVFNLRLTKNDKLENMFIPKRLIDNTINYRHKFAHGDDSDLYKKYILSNNTEELRVFINDDLLVNLENKNKLLDFIDDFIVATINHMEKIKQFLSIAL